MSGPLAWIAYKILLIWQTIYKELCYYILGINSFGIPSIPAFWKAVEEVLCLIAN